MMDENNGGAAFPLMPPCDMEGASAHGYPYPEAGMTLRDYFAAHALAGLLVRNWADEATGRTPDNVQELWAAGAYAMADAMLRFRVLRVPE